MKTIAQTGIRVGELKYVTVEAIQVGITIVWNKEKYRNVYLTNKLCEELQMYCSDNNISEGPIFCGNKKGQTITNGAVWKSLKYLAIQAGIPQELVYPHSFRHLFAKEYMQKIGDISAEDKVYYMAIDNDRNCILDTIGENNRKEEFDNTNEYLIKMNLEADCLKVQFISDASTKELKMMIERLAPVEVGLMVKTWGNGGFLEVDFKESQAIISNK